VEVHGRFVYINISFHTLECLRFNNGSKKGFFSVVFAAKEMVFKSRLRLGTKQNWSLVAVHIDIGCVVSVLKCPCMAMESRKEQP